jgi:hypothetical protein
MEPSEPKEGAGESDFFSGKENDKENPNKASLAG